MRWRSNYRGVCVDAGEGVELPLCVCVDAGAWSRFAPDAVVEGHRAGDGTAGCDDGECGHTRSSPEEQDVQF